MSSRFSFGSSDLSNNWICEAVDVLVLILSKCEMSGTDRGVALNLDSIFGVELNDLCLLEIWVAFNLVDDWSDLASCEKIEQSWDRAVAHANTLG